MLSPTLGDDRLGRRDDLEALRMLVVEQAAQIDRLERRVAEGTVPGLRYAYFAGLRFGVRLVCTECPGGSDTVAHLGYGARHAVVQDAIGRHEAERHGDGDGDGEAS